MAKTIKFNLICDGYPVRSLDELQEHFSIEDVLGYYKSGLLARWLMVRGYDQKLKQVKELNETEDIAIVKALVKIFDVETDEKVIEEQTYILGYKDRQKELNERFESQKLSREAVIQDYHQGYEDNIRRILEHRDDMAVIKAAIQDIDENYRLLFDVDYRILFNIFYQHAPMALFAMLMQDHMRKKYLQPVTADEATAEDERNNRILQLTNIFTDIAKRTHLHIDEDPEEELEVESVQSDVTLMEADRSEMHRKLNSLVNDTGVLQTVLGDYLEICGMKTAPYERALEDKGRYMILKIGNGDKVHSYGNINEEYDYNQINGQFVILDGLCYMSNSDVTSVFYLEV